MQIKEFLNISPHTITLIPTHKCTASCTDCCFGCTPNINFIMSLEDMKKYIDEAMFNFKDILLLVITGGECFLLGEDLVEIIRYTRLKYGLVVRVVSNAYWATSYSSAKKRLQKLVEAGLTEINFSSGTNHQKYVKFENIENAVQASYDLGIRSICISYETPATEKIKSKEILQNEKLKPLIENRSLYILDAAWMGMKNSTVDHSRYKKNISKDKRCKTIYNGITINPYSQMLACCGLTVEYNEYLKLGNLNNNSMKDLYTRQFNDFLNCGFSLTDRNTSIKS